MKHQKVKTVCMFLTVFGQEHAVIVLVTGLLIRI